ncbi:MAG: hypothetical protein QOH12_3347 [Solirubrobacteraceae bacterium]|jgi:2-polyprenyl-6-hydroxyphenyl methylase/3-demethylubiquinone-9 3-methyltransferase|nr:hypothetical protein [Solirubrobacteraceae bacterium]
MSLAFDKLELAAEARSCPDPGYVRAYRQRVAVALALVDECGSPGAEILDVAAAQGNLTIALAMRGYRVTWNDLRAELADYVRLKLGDAQISFCPGNVFEIQAGPFDIVLATEVIEHVAHPDEFLRQLARLVRPGGYLIVTTPNGGYLRNELPRFSDFGDPSVFEASQFKPDADGHIFLLHPDELDSLGRAAGLELVRVVHSTSVISRGWLRTGFLSRRLPEGILNAIDAGITGSPAAVRDRLTTNLAAIYRCAE